MFNNNLKQVLFVYAFDTTEFANASIHVPYPRLDRQDQADDTTQTIMAGNYAKIGERGWGRRAIVC